MSQIRVELNQATGRKLPRSFWQGWANRTARVVRLRSSGWVSLALVSAPAIRTLNRKYRGKDEVTDVLSFRQAEGGAVPGDKTFLGDVVICLPRASAQAKALKHSLRRELSVLFVHGLLHLLGYEHHRRLERDQMHKLEEHILGSSE